MIYQPPTALPPDLLADDDVQRALGAHDFGQVFRIAREKAGISYSKIATECEIKPERVGQLARGTGRITTFEKVVRIADALRIPGRMVGLASRPWEAEVAPAPSTTGPSLHRRTVLQVATAGGLAAALPALQQPDAPRHCSLSGPPGPLPGPRSAPRERCPDGRAAAPAPMLSGGGRLFARQGGAVPRPTSASARCGRLLSTASQVGGRFIDHVANYE
ncbi:helix-turn-helix domain-containing protein [Streptomyces sp. NPDC059913]|uniref:helix-turn-helix domain-containing protein n=1 Tax=unclassified Streptomyces TaxID=2593676 RepID=UPI00364904D9